MSSRDLFVSGLVGYEHLVSEAGISLPVIGGSGLYAAMGAAKFAPVHLIATVGNDVSRDVLHLAQYSSIDTSLLTIRGDSSFRWYGRYNTFGECKTERVDWGPLNVERLPPKLPKNCSILLANDDPAFQWKLITENLCETVFFGTNIGWLEVRPEFCLKIHSLAKFTVFSADEFALFRKLYTGPLYGKVIVTRGSAGVSLFTREGTLHFSAPDVSPAKIKDVTGAGDVFLGAISGYLSRSCDWSETLISAAVMQASSLVSLKLQSQGAVDLFAKFSRYVTDDCSC